MQVTVEPTVVQVPPGVASPIPILRSEVRVLLAGKTKVQVVVELTIGVPQFILLKVDKSLALRGEVVPCALKLVGMLVSAAPVLLSTPIAVPNVELVGIIDPSVGMNCPP